jgi:hypothetical protein
MRRWIAGRVLGGGCICNTCPISWQIPLLRLSLDASKMCVQGSIGLDASARVMAAAALGSSLCSGGCQCLNVRKRASR